MALQTTTPDTLRTNAQGVIQNNMDFCSSSKSFCKKTTKNEHIITINLFCIGVSNCRIPCFVSLFPGKSYCLIKNKSCNLEIMSKSC